MQLTSSFRWFTADPLCWRSKDDDDDDNNNEYDVSVVAKESVQPSFDVNLCMAYWPIDCNLFVCVSHENVICLTINDILPFLVCNPTYTTENGSTYASRRRRRKQKNRKKIRPKFMHSTETNTQHVYHNISALFTKCLVHSNDECRMNE